MLSLSSCVATSRLIHNGGYIQKLFSGRLYLVTNALLNLDQFYNILAAINYFKFRKSAIMDQFETFPKRVYIIYSLDLDYRLSSDIVLLETFNRCTFLLSRFEKVVFFPNKNEVQSVVFTK